MASSINALTKTYDLVLWMSPHLEKFPKQHRFMFGDRILNKLLDIMELLVEANYTHDRLNILKRANIELEILRYHVRLAKDMDLFSLDRYEFAAREINEIGTQVGGWIKMHKVKNSEENRQPLG